MTDFSQHQPRKIDALIVAGGINDARFADLATMCVLNWGCPLGWVGETPGTQRKLPKQFEYDVARVPGGWKLMAEQLATPRPLKNGTMAKPIESANKLALQYPPFFRDDEGDQCTFILWDTLPGWAVDEMDQGEFVWAPLLNKKVREGANQSGFAFVDTIAKRFSRHGICADDNYINTPSDSEDRQGDDRGEAGVFASVFSKGSAHPNIKGYGAYADEILRHLNSLTEKDTENAPPVASGDKMSVARISFGRYTAAEFDVLANDSDPDPDDMLAARMATQPTHGSATMRLDGTVTYTPKNGYVGPDSFVYEVTDGVASRFAVVEINVFVPLKRKERLEGGIVPSVDGLLDGTDLEPPYRIVFDEPLRAGQGTARIDPDLGTLEVTPPRVRNKRIDLRYTIYSDTTNRRSPSYGGSVAGFLRLRVKTPRT